MKKTLIYEYYNQDWHPVLIGGWLGWWGSSTFPYVRIEVWLDAE